ncbi:MAG: hypothetical protein ABIO39_02650 [Caulobacteraceae bacterium]
MSETLEVRLTYPTKLAFMARCQDEGLSASETVRHFIDNHLGEGQPGRPVRARSERLIAGALIAALAGAIALPSLARPSQRADFACLDRNGDNRVDLREFTRPDANHDGKISFEEFRAACGAGKSR